MINNTQSKNKTRISITILPSINLMLDKESKNIGVSKSELIENALKSYLRNKLQHDAKILGQMHFDDLPSETEWFMMGPQLEPYDEH
ncbi:MAG: ribbon-helix-helix domain-containing protein [Candidatus Gracilibacteria bacterium]